jgi:hypothetical protein
MALRTARQVPAIYFGRPGKLVSLPWPKGGIDKPYDRLTFDFVTGSGYHQVSSLSAGSRSYTISWEALHSDNFAKLAQYRTGMNGAGPWTIIDPSAMNLFLPNQSAATGLYNEARDFQTLTGLSNEGSLSSNSDASFIFRAQGSRSLRWLFPVAAATVPVLLASTAYRSWPGIPAVVGLPYTFSSIMRADGIVDSAITVGLRLRWLDSTGAQISESTSGNIPITAAWTRLTATGTAPANTYFVEPRWIAVGSTITTGASIYIDEPLLEQDSVVNDWAPGTGVRPVEIVDLGEVVPFEARFRTGASMTLRELAK